MAVYIDPLFGTPRSKTWRYDQACHMLADTVAELDAFASRIGLRREWRQTKPFHYDLTPSRRAAAVKAGAVEITQRQMVDIVRAMRHAADVADVMASPMPPPDPMLRSDYGADAT